MGIWPPLANYSYDPCRARGLPAAEEELPPFFHYCLGYEIPHLKDQSYKISKYKLPKDLLDCGSALIRYNPVDALERYKHQKGSPDFMNTWMVCMMTNLINAYVTVHKKHFCTSPNLKATFVLPPLRQEASY